MGHSDITAQTEVATREVLNLPVIQEAPVFELVAIPGMTIREVLDSSLPESMRGHKNVLVYNKGVEIKQPELYYFNEGDRLAVYLVPEGGGGGGKSGIKGILQVIVGVILIAVTWGVAAIGVAGITGLTAVGQAIGVIGASLALGGLASLIAPPPSINTNDAKAGDTTRFLITGQSNQARFYSPVLKVYGRHKVFPAVVTLPRIDNIGTRSDIAALYDWGMGEVHLSSLRIGETPIEAYTTDVINHINMQDPPLRWVGFKAHQDALALVTEYGKAHTIRTLENTIGCDIDISFLYGFIGTSDKGESQPSLANFQIRYREVITGGAIAGEAAVDFPPGNSVIRMGEHLIAGETRTAPNGWYRLIMQGDGNLVLYAKNNVAVWSSGTEGNAGAVFIYGGTPVSSPGSLPNFNPGTNTMLVGATMFPGSELVSDNGWYKLIVQGDGNVVIYAKNGKAVWDTGTAGHPGARFVYSPSTIIGLPVAPSPDFPLVGGEFINMGETLHAGDMRTSANGWFRVVMQADGNLVIYSKNGSALWSTNTAGHPGARFVWFNSGNPNGIFAIISATNKTLWKRGPFQGQMVIQGDGNLVLYDASKKAVWSSGYVQGDEPSTPVFPVQPPAPDFPSNKPDSITAGNTLFENHELVSASGKFRFIVQPDGNCVIYSKDGRAIWDTATAGNPGARLVYDTAGYLRVYSLANNVLFGKGPWPGGVLRMQDDGNLVLYVGTVAKWSSGTAEDGTPLPPVVQPPPSVPDIPIAAANKILMGETMHAGDSRTSANGWYMLSMQYDGNLVIYAKNGTATWSTRTQGAGARFVYFPTGIMAVVSASNATLKNLGRYSGTLTLQDDGNLVCYDSSGRALWDSRSASPVEPAPPAPAPTPPPPTPPATGLPNFPPGNNALPQFMTLIPGAQLTSANGWYKMVMQLDGNLVIYNKADRAVWDSKTQWPGARLVYDHEGNLRIYTPENKILFAKNNMPGGSGILQDDGNFVVYRNGQALWHTGYASGAEPRIGARSAPANVDYGGLYVYSPDNQLLWHQEIPDGRIVLQGDGNLVAHDGLDNVKWASGSGGIGEPSIGATIPIAEPGAIRIYNADGKIIWDQGVHPGTGNVQGDGNFVFYDSTNHVLWASHSGGGNEEPMVIENRGNWIPVGPKQISGIPARWATGSEPTTFNASWYVATYPDVRNDERWSRDPYGHYQQIGKFKNYMKGPPSGGIMLIAESRKPITACVHIDFPFAGQWEIEIKRTSQVADGSKAVNSATITLLESQIPGPVLNLPYAHTFTEMKVRASGKLSGVVQNLSAIATSVLKIYNENGSVVARKASRNPAWIVIDILTGESNPRPVSWEMIDWPSWKKLADYCDEKRTWVIDGKSVQAARHTCDIVVDYLTTVRELTFSILSGCRAALVIGLDGKYGVQIDSQRDVPRQLITTANSWDFSGNRQFTSEIHGVRVSFLDSTSDYQKQEIIAYRDGYNEGNATKIEDLGTFGITDYYQAWAFGRYHLACAIHRAEIFSLKMDIENLAFTRGDLVAVAHDVPQVGGQPCRVVSVSAREVTVNEFISSDLKSYTVRLQNGTIRQGSVTARVDEHIFELDNVSGIQADDLIVFGEPYKVTKHYLVQAISPQPDLSADISLVPYVHEIYDADIKPMPGWDAGLTGDYINKTDLAAHNLTAVETLVYIDRVPHSRITFTWTTTGLGYGYSEFYMTTDGDLKVHIGTSQAHEHTFDYDLNTLREKTLFGTSLMFECVPITGSGLGGEGGIVAPVLRSTSAVARNFTGGLSGKSAYTFVELEGNDKDVTPPTNYSVDVQDMIIELRWDPSIDPDIDTYELRFSPDVLNGTWENSQYLTTLPWSVHKTSVGARTGKYFIQAMDTSGNKSTPIWQRTTVESLPNVNQVKKVNDATTGWLGAVSHLERVGADLVLKKTDYDDGIYVFEQMVDFGSVFEVRISSQVIGIGTLEDGTLADGSLYTVDLEYRGISQILPMDKWIPIETQKPLAKGLGSWSEWRSVIVGDVTARFLQFRIIVVRKHPGVTVTLKSGAIEIDATDWVFRQSNVVTTIAGVPIVYTPAFMDKPVVAISIDGGSNAVSYKLEAQSRLGCKVTLLDANGNPCPGQFDISVAGQGRERPFTI